MSNENKYFTIETLSKLYDLDYSMKSIKKLDPYTNYFDRID